MTAIDGKFDKQCYKVISSLIALGSLVYFELPPEILSIHLWQNPGSMISQRSGPGYSIIRLGKHWEAQVHF